MPHLAAPAAARLFLCFCLVFVGCGPAALQTGTNTGPTVSVGGATRRITTLTDVDQVRDVAVAAGKVYVATDRGVLVYPDTGDPVPVRISRATSPALPSDDVFAVVAAPDGATLIATARGIAALAGDQVTPIPTGPPVGRVMRMAITHDGSIWACGVAGLARLREGHWAKFGEDMVCTTLAPTPEGQLWVGTTTGMWMVEGEVIREHAASRGMPEGYVRDVVPVRSGQVFALLQGPSSQVLGLFDGQRWVSYTIPDFEPAAVGFGRVGRDVVLFTAGHAFAIRPAEGGIQIQGAVSLRPLAVSEPGGVRSFGARITPADQIQAPDPAVLPDNTIRAATSLAEVPQGAPTIDAPDLSVVPLEALRVPVALSLVRAFGDQVLMADRGRGVVQVPAAGGAPRELRTRDLIEEMDLQIATDAGGRTWVLSKEGDLAKMGTDALERVRVADDFEPMALATGPNGAYVLGRVGQGGSTIRVVRTDAETFAPVVERTLTLPPEAPFVGVPFMGVAGDGKIWAAIDVAREGGQGKRTRGVALIDPASEAVVYFHRTATPETDGVGALMIPDEVSTIDFDDAGNVWLATLSGAVRIGGSQAIVFGESRGVRGEVVSDLAVGEMDRVWVASAEGVGYYENRNFEFRLPAVVREARPTALAMDLEGHLWGAGQNGLVFHDGEHWLRLTEQNGLPTNRLVDVEVDGANRVWVLAGDRLMVLARQ